MTNRIDHKPWYWPLKSPEANQIPPWLRSFLVFLFLFFILVLVIAIFAIIIRIFIAAITGDGEFLKNSSFLIAALVALPLAIWRAVIADHEKETEIKKYDQLVDKEYVDLFNSSISKINDNRGDEPDIPVRIAALAALKRIERYAAIDVFALRSIISGHICAEIKLGKYWKKDSIDHTDEKSMLRDDVKYIFDYFLNTYRKNTEDRTYHYDLYDIHIADVDLTRSNFHHISLTKSIFNDCLLGGSDFYSCNMDGLSFINCFLSGAKFEKCDPRGLSISDVPRLPIEFKNCNFSDCKFERIEILDFSLEGICGFIDCIFNEINFQEQNFSSIDLHRSRFIDCRIDDSNLHETKMYDVLLQEVSLSCSDLSETIGLKSEQIEDCFGCAGTVLPEGVERPSHWSRNRLTNRNTRRKTFNQWKLDRKQSERERIS